MTAIVCTDFNVFQQLASTLSGKKIVMPFIESIDPLKAFQRGTIAAAVAYILTGLS